SSVAFHPDGRLLASADKGGMVKLWDVKSSRPVVLRGHSGYVSRVAFRRDSRRVLTDSRGVGALSPDNTTRVWDPVTGDAEQVRPGTETGSLDPGFTPGGSYGDWVVASPDGRKVARMVRSGDVQILDAATHRLLRTLRGHSRFAI